MELSDESCGLSRLRGEPVPGTIRCHPELVRPLISSSGNSSTVEAPMFVDPSAGFSDERSSSEPIYVRLIERQRDELAELHALHHIFGIEDDDPHEDEGQDSAETDDDRGDVDSDGEDGEQP